MKTKEQKRREAIERLEREPRFRAAYVPDELVGKIRERRRAEAKRLREKFGFTSAQRSAS